MLLKVCFWIELALFLKYLCFPEQTVLQEKKPLLVWMLYLVVQWIFLHHFQYHLLKESELETYKAPSQENLSCVWCKGCMSERRTRLLKSFVDDSWWLSEVYGWQHKNLSWYSSQIKIYTSFIKCLSETVTVARVTWKQDCKYWIRTSSTLMNKVTARALGKVRDKHSLFSFAKCIVYHVGLCGLGITTKLHFPTGVPFCYLLHHSWPLLSR